MTRRTKLSAIAEAFHDSCLAELDALKPGNVHRFADDERMSVADFERSAAAAAPAMGRAGLSVGKRILGAVEATRNAVGQNTNLGIILLAAPLASAALDREGGDLRARVGDVLDALTVQDARDTYEAIRIAQPGGLGEAPSHDVAAEPRVTLLEAMRAAEARDRIAWNYTHGLSDIFGLGLVWLKQAHERWGNSPFAVTRVYLGFLAHLSDTLIERKFGTDVAASSARGSAAAGGGIAGMRAARGHDRAADGLRPRAQGARAEPRHIGRSHGGDGLCRSHRGGGKPSING